MKKMSKKAFTLIELIVVVAVVGILVLLGMPRFIGHKDKAELARIQHDVKVMEQEIGTVLINNDDDFNKWEDNSKDFNQLIKEGRLFEKEGVAEKVEPIDKVYKVIPEEYKDKINTKLKGTFYANNDGKVYYEHEKPLLGIPTEPEKEPGYSDEEIQDLIKIGYIPVATAKELNNVRLNGERIYGAGTKWEGLYTGGLDKHYVQVTNINLSGYSEEGWNPIGTYDSTNSDNSEPFTGIYDGANYVITGLEIKGADKDYQGLFGYIEGATIRNVALEDINVTGNKKVGGLVGYSIGSTIDNSYTTGPVTGKYEVGGLVGRAGDYYNGTTISNSYTTGPVTGSTVGGLVGWTNHSTIENSYAIGDITGGNYAGGLVGNTYQAKIRNSYATGEVTSTGETHSLGGLVGYNNGGVIENSYATGAVTGTESHTVGGLSGDIGSAKVIDSYATGSVVGDWRVGGLVGYASDDSAKISNSYATGPVIGSGEYVGGLVGWADSTIESSYSTSSVKGNERVGGLAGYASHSAKISNTYAKGSVTGSGNYVGGLVGYAYSENKISNSYWNTETTEQEESAGGAGKSTDEMKKKATYSGWNFDTVWKIDEGNGYPKLR